MPVKNERQKQLDDLERALYQAVLMDVFDEDDDVLNPSEPSLLDELATLPVRVESSRYLIERETTEKCTEFARKFFTSLPDERFRKMVRMSRLAFEFVLEQIQDNLKNESNFPQAPVWLQLAVTLYRLGNYGNGASLGRTMELWGIGKGTCALYTYRGIAALNDIVDKFVVWPAASGRAKISRRMKAMGFKGCVGFIDGTTIPLSQRPAADGECYFDRKCRYSLNAQVVCDDRRRIISFYSGWPGSCADSSVYQEMQLAKSEPKPLYFSPGEYLLADSAYPADILANTIVPAYKKNSNGEDNVEFNTCLAHARVVNEYTIGVWKARWSSLREIRIQIKKMEDIDRILRWMAACVVLHNILRDLGDEWPEDDEEESDDEEDDLTADYDDEAYPFRARIKAQALAKGRQPGGILW